MRVAAFDLGATMACSLSGGATFHKHFEGTRHERVTATLLWLDDLMGAWVTHDEGIDAVIYERPFARGQHATRSLWGIAGLIEAVAGKHGFLVLDATPADIKKFAAGKGEADKDDMQAAAFLLGYSGDNEHEADAYCLKEYAEAKVLRKIDEPPKTKRSKKS